MKIKIEINQSTFEKIKNVYEKSKDVYTRMNLNTVEEFITYILENFSTSSDQFEKLNDQMKGLMENINLDDFSFEDLFKNIAKTNAQKAEKKSEEKKDSDINKKS